jgi:hypothetical protein
MTPLELDIFRVNAKVLALETLLATILSGFAAFPEIKSLLIKKLDEFPEEFSKITLTDIDPAYSDMLSSEAHQAAESLTSFLKLHINRD